MNDFSDFRLIKDVDLIFAPISLLVLLIIARSVRLKYSKTEIYKYFFPALLTRFLFTFLFILVINFFYGFGDTNMYYAAITDIHKALSDNPSLFSDIFFRLKLTEDNPLYTYFYYDGGAYTHLYMLNVSNYMVPRFGVPFSLLFSNSYFAISFCFTFFSFAGCWRMFKMFVYWYPQLHKKLAIAFLFLPSVLFWGGSVMKDSICLGAIGFLLYGLFNIFIKKNRITSSLLWVIFSSFLLFYIKTYIILSIIPAIIIALFLRFRKRISDKTLRQFATILLFVISLGAGFFALSEITKNEMASQFAADKILKSSKSIQEGFSLTGEEGQGSNFNIGTASETFGDLLLLFPIGLATTLFRPFLWEAGSPFMLFSALEGLAILTLTIMSFKKIGFKKFFSITGSDSVLVFCLVYSLIFAGIVGVTTTNFGALMRYKIPAIPFYLALLFVVMDKSGRFSPNIIFNKRLF